VAGSLEALLGFFFEDLGTFLGEVLGAFANMLRRTEPPTTRIEAAATVMPAPGSTACGQ
jgi:hypothetical protein